MNGFWEHVLMPMLGYAAWVGLPIWLANRTRLPHLGVGGGTGILVRRDAWARIGGHAALRDAVVDDIALVRQLRAAGFRTAVVDARDAVAVRMYRGGREVVEGFTKNVYYAIGGSVPKALAAMAITTAIYAMPAVCVAVGLLDGWTSAASIGAATIAIVLLTRLLVLREFGGRIDNALLGLPLMLFGWLWIGLRSTWRVGVRGRLEWRGREYDAGDAKFGG